MPAEWKPEPVLRKAAEKLLRDVSEKIKAKRRKPWKSSKNQRQSSTPGGSLAKKALSKSMLDSNGSTRVTVKFALLGQKFLWLRRGTVHQRKHPIKLTPNRKELRAEVEDHARKHFAARDSKEAPRE